MAKDNEVVKELDEVETEKDFFEKLLEEEIDPKGGDEEDGQEKESDSKTEKESEPESKANSEEESVEALKARIAELEKERKGQLDSVVKSRQERSRFKSELNELKDAVSSLLAQRDEKEKALGKEENETKKAVFDDPKAKVEFDESGDTAYVDLSAIKEAIENGDSVTREELEALKQERAAEEAKKNFITNVQSVIDENKEVYTDAYKELGKIYTDLNNKIIELQERTGETGENGVLSQDRALELFSGSPEEKAFQKEHPGIDPTRVARALNTKVDLKLTLSHLADTLKIGVKDTEDVIDEKIEKAKNKPGGLGGHGNQRAEDTGDLISRISSLSANDFEDLSDAEVAKIEQMLLREETNSN